MSRPATPLFEQRVRILVTELAQCDPEDDELVLNDLNDLIKLAQEERAQRFPDGWIEAGTPPAQVLFGPFPEDDPRVQMMRSWESQR